MDYIRQLGPVVLDHRLRRMMEILLRSAEEIYEARGLTFRGRWASTYRLLYNEGPLAVGQIADRLRLTHPGVIGITDEMMAAEIADAVRDPGDARRRMLALTPRGKRMSAELFDIWAKLGKAQEKRFADAGCEIMTVLGTVEDGLAARSLTSEMLEELADLPAKKSGGRDNSKRVASPGRRATRASLSVFAAVLLSASAFAAPEAQTLSADNHAKPIDAAARTALVDALSDSLISGYIYEKTGRTMADTLRAELRAGAYDRIAAGDSLARRITQTLRRLSDDRHLGVRFGSSPRMSGQPVRRAVGVPAGSSSGTGTASGTGASAGASTGPVLRRVPAPAPDTVPLPPGAFASPDYGIARAQILAGNVGYLDLRGFSGDPAAVRAADSAMAVLANAKALIIDVGRNRGGGPPMIQHVSAYLFDKRTHLVSSFARGMSEPMERWTAERVAGKRLPDIPVYILTSGQTISAAESFAFGLRITKRATIVGERTAGGGHFGGFVPLPGGFSVFLPRGRTYDPRTNKGWEAEGLEPDVQVPYARAMETVLKLIEAKR